MLKYEHINDQQYHNNKKQSKQEIQKTYAIHEMKQKKCWTTDVIYV